MDSLIHVIGIVLLFSICVVGLLSLLIGLPGTFLILAAVTVYGWATGFAAVQWTTIGWLTLLAVIAEGLELAASALATAGERPSWRVSVAALVGGVAGGLIGTPFLFGVGSLVGALAGAFAGAAAAVASEGGGAYAAVRTGMAAMSGRLLGFVLKSAIAVVMILVVAGALL